MVVTSLLVKYMDPRRYRAVVVGEAEDDVLQYQFGKIATYYRIRRAYGYHERLRLRQAFGPRPIWTRRLLRGVLHRMRLLTNLPYHLRLAAVVLRERVDLIHHSNGLVRPFLALFGRPMVGTLQGLRERRLSLLQRLALKRFRLFIMISQVVHERYLAIGGRPEIAVLIPNPCDPTEIPEGLRTRARAELGVSRGAKLFGIVGRVVPWKGQREFLTAADKVLADNTNAVAVIVGDAADGADDYFDELRGMAAASPFADRIIFTGYVEDMKRIYAALDVAVHASIRPEPFGLVITEALGHGIPIVAAASGGPAEVVEHGVDGFLVDPTNAPAMAAAVSTLLSDDLLRGQMGQRGKEKAFSSTYHAKPYAGRVQDLYDTIFEGC